jgi:hypothetical protein
MSTENPTKPLSNIIIRIIGSIIFIALAYNGYQFGAVQQGVLGVLIRILSAAGCFVGLMVFYRAVMELINRRKASKL